MGKAYELQCTECTYEETFYVGVGFNDRSMAEEAIRDLDAGGYGEEAREFAIRSGQGEVECRRMLYRCRKCKNLETRVKMRILTEQVSFSQPYFCTKCGKLLGQVKPADIKKQLCPVCGKPVQVVDTFDWDIAPIPEK